MKPLEPSHRRFGRTPKHRYDPTSPQAQDLVAAVGMAIAVGLIGGFLGLFVNMPLLGLVCGAVLGYVLGRWVIPGVAAMLIHFIMPSGSSTPPQAAYSEVEALEARGDYTSAETWYRRSLAERPTDPEPALRLARMYRDRLDQFEDAVTAFRRARSIGLSPGAEVMVTRQIIEIFTHKVKEPRRAIPELARLTERSDDQDTVRWAKEELTRVRAATIIPD